MRNENKCFEVNPAWNPKSKGKFEDSPVNALWDELVKCDVDSARQQINRYLQAARTP